MCSSIFADMFRGGRVDVVAGPALGGIILAYEVARSLGVRNIFAEREIGKMTFRRGFHVNPGEFSRDLGTKVLEACTRNGMSIKTQT